MSMNYRKLGFTQRRPQLPGVYFVSVSILRPGRFAPPRNAEGWDVAEVIFWAGSYTNAHDNRESAAHWRIKCLDGLEYAWKPGMWMKGPITPASEMPNVRASRPVRVRLSDQLGPGSEAN